MVAKFIRKNKGRSRFFAADGIIGAVMAALPELPDTHVLDLRKISAADVTPVLEEERIAWRDALDWDLTSSVELVRRFVGMQALNGVALLYGSQVIGFAYSVRDEHKGLVGDLYILEQERTPQRVSLLMEAVLESLWRAPGVHRVESQLLMMGAVAPRTLAPAFAQWLRTFPRLFLEISADAIAALAEQEPAGVKLRAWTEAKQEESARLVAAAYRGHVDSDINDQYRSAWGARRFLNNIVQYPGCGTFQQKASMAATDPANGALVGMSLASLVAPDVGHITQICVAPGRRGIGLGYELLRRSLTGLAEQGCRSVGLTVTAANQPAARLYQDMGFTLRREFPAHVWDSW